MNASQSVKQSFSKPISALKSQKGLVYIVVIVMALFAFEAFNFGTTDYALTDLLGDLKFFGIRWATLLSIAFCAIDFTGIAKLFAPQTDQKEANSGWYMFGAWILAATMNAILTWWGVVMAMENHSVLSAAIVNASSIGKAVPIFIALMVWVIRILLIGSLSQQWDRKAKAVQEAGPAGMSRREFRQAQSRAAHPGNGQRSIPVGLHASSAAKNTSTRRQKRPEATYVPVQEEMAFRTLNASSRQGRRI
jgi:hypothetical protein